ncbi:uncharacterized protein LOC141840192 [Curcuma longa]|uniref:uncharacterized protein LOC141840192 n=1 Tax=Curcuma longa TaxID=136217 RepID=UPI003D9E8F33
MGSHGRPLCELLRQQQEPFVLDVYLAERGLSERLLLLASSKSPSCTFCCRANAYEKPQFLTSHGFIKYWKNAFAWFHRNHHRHSSYSIDHTVNWQFFPFLDLYDAEVVLSLPRNVLNIFNEILEAAHTTAFYQLIGSKRKMVEKESIHEKILLMVRQQKRLTCNLVKPSEFSSLSNVSFCCHQY